MTDRSAILAAFRAGIFTFLSSLTRVERDVLLKTNPDIHVDRAWRGGDDRFSVRADLPNKPWNDYRVRKALSKAIDRKGIVEALYAPDDPWASGEVPPGLQPWALPLEELEKMDFLKYDPKEAKRLMAEAGFPNGFKTTMCWPTVGTTPEKRVLLVSEMWKENLGVELDLSKGLDSSGWLGTCFAGRSQDSIDWIPMSGTTNWFDFLLFNVHSQGKWPSTQIKSAELDKLIDEAMAALDVEEQVKKAREVQRLMFTSEKYGYWIPMTKGAIYEVAQPWARNWRPLKANNTWWSFVWVDK